MKRTEVSGTDWTIPQARYKTGLELVIPLSLAAIAILDSTLRIGRDFVFTNDGKRRIAGFSKVKHAFDDICGVTDWTLHDLRRTARALMSRAGVQSDHAERCLGHVLAVFAAPTTSTNIETRSAERSRRWRHWLSVSSIRRPTSYRSKSQRT